MTNPSGATCTLTRHGEMIGKVETPGNIMVKRRKYDIDIRCNKPGYAEAEYVNRSGLSSMVAGNIAADLILTAGISSIVDSANGADNEYTPTVVLSLNLSDRLQAVANRDGQPVQTTSSAATAGAKLCSHDELVQARISRLNGYTGGPNCSNNL